MALSYSYTPPEYLQVSRTGLISFRYRVPNDLREAVGKSEWKYSLKTRSLREARKHLANILPTIQNLVKGLKIGYYKKISPEIIHETVYSVIQKARTSFTPLPQLEAKTIQVQATSEIIVADTPSPKPVKQEQEVSTNTTSFSDIKDAFLKEKELSNEWRFKTQEDHKQVFSLFKEVSGDVSVDQIDKPLMRQFKTTLMSLPPNMRKLKQYRDKTIKQIVAMKPKKTVSPHTINKYLSRLSNLFSYAVDHGYMESNPANGLKVKLKTRPDEERSAYTQEDLQKLFAALPTHQSYMQWAPLIGLYTGCRLEEICQLHLEDIRQENGVIVFDINDKEEKHLKTLASRRLIPVHSKLVEAGLLQYVYDLQAKGEQRLFPELRQRRDGYGQTVSKWFQRYKDRCGIEKDKTFHSFRHTFITHLKHKGVDPFMIHELDGHTVDSEFARYGKRYTPEILLREAIEKIDYELPCCFLNSVPLSALN